MSFKFARLDEISGGHGFKQNNTKTSQSYRLKDKTYSEPEIIKSIQTISHSVCDAKKSSENKESQENNPIPNTEQGKLNDNLYRFTGDPITKTKGTSYEYITIIVMAWKSILSS